MKWYEQLGYPENPLLSQNGPYHLDEAIEELLYHIEAGNMILIQGEKGTGKTALLRKAIDNYGGEKKVIYFDCENQNVNLRLLMQNRYGWFGRLFNILPKDMILLLDNFTKLSQNDLERLKYYFDNDFMKAVVLSSEHEPQLPDSVKDRIGLRVIQLKPLTQKEAVELVNTRLGSNTVLSDTMISKIYAAANDDVRDFLSLTSSALQAAADAGSAAVEQQHIDKVK